MVREVIWNDQALADVIKDHIARDSLARAETVVAVIERAADGLSDFPFRFRKIPEFEDDHRRETFVYEYRLMYRIEPETIRISRVVHGRRLLKNVPGGFEEEAQTEYCAA